MINGKGHAIPHIMQGQAFLSQELGPVIKKPSEKLTPHCKATLLQ